MKTSWTINRGRRGTAYILALVLLAIFSTLAVAFSASTDLDLRKSENTRLAGEARLATESGLGFMLEVLESLRLPGTTTQETFYANLQDALADRLEGTPNLAGGCVTSTGTTVAVPEIQIEGKTFCCWFNWVDDNRCRLKVKGSSAGMSRYVTVDLMLVSTTSAAFNFGLASKGQISIFGNARIVGTNNPTEASVISITTSHLDAICLDGHAEVSGDLYTTAEGAHVSISGTPTVAGETDPVEIAKHINKIEEPDFPEINSAPIAELASYILQPGDVTTTGVFNNLIIPAGMNPTFTSDVELNGVVYIEAPNEVCFEGKCTINGIIVTVETGEPISNCLLHFAGHVEANGVEVLPDTPEFADVKQNTGTSILAPGFDVTFAGSVSVANGTIAADKLTFTGTAEGSVKGSVIGLKDLPTSVGGNVDIFVDHKGIDKDPAGFIKPFRMEILPDSYTELTGE